MPRTISYAPPATDNGLCQFTDRRCSRPKVDGQKLCVDHTKQSPDGYRRCTYASFRSGIECVRLVLKNDTGKEGFCIVHSRMVAQMRRQSAYKRRHRDSADSILESLRHYRNFANDQNALPREWKTQTIQQQQQMDRTTQCKGRRHIDYLSESSDEDEALVSVDECPQFEDDQICDTVIDDPTDPLRNASVFTAHEVVAISRDRLVRQQALYWEYLDLISEKYRLRRSFYKKRVDEEARNGPFVTDDYQSQKHLRQLKALKNYRRRSGPSSVYLHRRRLSKSVGHLYYGDGRLCTNSTPIACPNLALPDTAYCAKHILDDSKQQLFVVCRHPSCCAAILNLNASQCFCWQHRPVPSKFSSIDCHSQCEISAQDPTPVHNNGRTSSLVQPTSSSSPAALENFSKIVEQVVTGQLDHS